MKNYYQFLIGIVVLFAGFFLSGALASFLISQLGPLDGEQEIATAAFFIGFARYVFWLVMVWLVMRLVRKILWKSA